jgi:hypothetical protein
MLAIILIIAAVGKSALIAIATVAAILKLFSVGLNPPLSP